MIKNIKKVSKEGIIRHLLQWETEAHAAGGVMGPLQNTCLRDIPPEFERAGVGVPISHSPQPPALLKCK